MLKPCPHTPGEDASMADAGFLHELLVILLILTLTSGTVVFVLLHLQSGASLLEEGAETAPMAEEQRLSPV
jgi:hypothetical protein